MATVHHRYAEVRGQWLFYREAGPVDATVVVLLHDFPTSSFMYRNLVPLLADRYHVIAPDHLGSGLSDAPAVDDFDYTLAALADLTAGLLARLGVTRFAMYVQGQGAAVGWRLALSNPDAVAAIVSQNGNGHEAGLAEEFWHPAREYWQREAPETEAALRRTFTLEAIRWQYLHGVLDQTLICPDVWYHDFFTMSRPGNDLVRLRLLADHAGDLALYPRLHAFLRDRRVPLLIVWGRDDEVFRVEGALALADEAPHAELCLLEGGHFLLESHLDTIAGTVRRFLGTATG